VKHIELQVDVKLSVHILNEIAKIKMYLHGGLDEIRAYI